MATRRLYYDDAFEKEFTARVMHCEVLPPDVKSGITDRVWGLILDRTAFYPTSGGQPNDLGKIGDANVLDVRDEGDEILHLVDRKPSDAEVNCCINWPRRFDHMQQHTGQHLLSAMFQERFGLPTVSFHLGDEICTIDLRGVEPSAEFLEGAERAANQVVFEDRPVNVRYGTADEFAELGVRKEVERKGILRAIEIESADLQPCGGTHVKRTGQIGLVLVRRCAKVRQDWRVEFVCALSLPPRARWPNATRISRVFAGCSSGLRKRKPNLRCKVRRRPRTASVSFHECSKVFLRIISASLPPKFPNPKKQWRCWPPRTAGTWCLPSILPPART